ncbi:hypothetical protein I316_06850 [Kwoniella heveanensis BCC8398]|uniref:Enoyl reductase (ER) domain-containing protein n=1 Tax=Kwoniella heveanensis BCC8398 TaxID=1296120 RepID=A0A1B9GKD8_9TREE|nr:hypothetical protein I316_06850 [Kwoniella heveanensis BCC8398]
MKAVVIKGAFKVEVEQQPVPTIQKPTDVIIKTHYSGLCGSDLHNYRQTEPGTGFILGHEVVGEIVEIGAAVQKFKVGDVVASPFSLSCGNCWYCNKGYPARCHQATFYGCPQLPGCQAEFVRTPLADASLFLIPQDVKPETMLLMGDILPTGYSCAYNARRLLDEDDERVDLTVKDGVAVVIGCGPVGLCAITSAKSMFSHVFATDPTPERRQLAKHHGAIALPLDELEGAVLAATEGRGADAALELVGNEGAVNTALDLVRPFGVVSSIGIHIKPLTISGDTLYSKNVRMQFGRCSVRKYFPGALKVLQQNKDLFSRFIEHKVRFDQAEEYYDLFNRGKIAKTVFVADVIPL